MSDTTTTPANVADVEEAMRDVVDPELGINVVDLGLVYGITVDPQMARSVARLAGLSQRQRDCLVMALRVALDESPGTLAGTARI